MQKRLHIWVYALGDFIASIIAWILFFWIHRNLGYESFAINNKFLAGLILYPTGYFILYQLSGAYKGIYYKSRLIELLSTFLSAFLGSIILFFVFYYISATNTFLLFMENFSFCLAYNFSSLILLGILS